MRIGAWLRGLVSSQVSPSDGLGLKHRALPEDFDWRAYLSRYPDLVDAGITTESGATNHWLRHGRAEGRWATRASYETRNTLTCASMHSVYLRATGAVVCWDDAGSDTVLQEFDSSVDYGRDVYLGDVFNRIRTSLWSGSFPFPETCKRCLVLRANSPHSSYHLDQRVIEIVQIEPSYKCSLDCPGCVPLDVRKLAPPRDLDPRVLGKIVGDFVAAGITVRAFDFQGHGEPLMNRDLWGLTAMVRAAYPESYVTVTTNAQGVVRESLASSGLDEVVCSIDGADEASFAPYRVNGRFDLAYKFMRDTAALGRSLQRRIKVIWKYILFEHNSSDARIRKVQELAEQARIDEIVFVFTRNGPRARHLERPTDLPLRETAIPISFRFHEPDVAELAARVEVATRQRSQGDAVLAAALESSVRAQLERFFPEGAPAPSLISEIRDRDKR